MPSPVIAAYAGDARGLPGQVPQNNNTLYTRLLAQPYQTQPWSTQFPELVTILDDPVSPHAPRVPLPTPMCGSVCGDAWA